jgi:LysM repeat protein
VVQAGDNPAKIAAKYGVDAGELMRVNNITDPRRLRVGQELIIPDGSAPGAPAAATSSAPPSAPTPTAVPTDGPRN